MDWKEWRNFLNEEKQVLKEGIGTGAMVGTSVPEAIEKLDSYADKTWIFFDTESTGFDQNKDQVTEIAAIAVSPNNWTDPKIVGTYHEKIKLNPDILRRLNDPESPERKEWEKAQAKMYKPLNKPQDVLGMTRYGEKGVKYKDEQMTLDEFRDFITGFKDPVLVAQNASHDMKFVNGRLRQKLPKIPVIDTVPLLKFQLIPLLQSLTDVENIQKNVLPNLPEDKKDEFLQVFKMASGVLDMISGRGGPSASLGKIADAFEINADEWHNALADTKMLIEVFKKTYNTLQLIKKYNIKTYFYHTKAVRKDRFVKMKIRRGK
jgi:DNA polymerase III epsilon subunit-like protein